MNNLENEFDHQRKDSSHKLEYTMLLITVIILFFSGYIYENLYDVPSISYEFYNIINVLLVLFIFLIPFIILIVRRRKTQDAFIRSFVNIYMVAANYLFLMLKFILPGYDLDIFLLYVLIGEVSLLLMAIAVIKFKNKVLRLLFYFVAIGFNVFLIWFQLLMIAFRGGGPHG